MSQFLKNKNIASALIALLLTTVLSVGIFTNTFTTLHEGFSDSLYNLNEPSQDIVIVAIDDKSTQPEALGRFSQWSRQNFTELLKVLEKESPKVQAFDLLFHTYSTSIPRDVILRLRDEIADKESNRERLDAYEEFVEKYRILDENPTDMQMALQMQKTPNLVLAAIWAGESLIEPLPEFSYKAKLGIVNSNLDEAGILRSSIPYFKVGEDTYDDFAVATAKEFLGTDTLEIPTENDSMMVNFFGEPFSYKMISFIDVLLGNYEKDAFKDKIVLVGATSSKEIHDEFYTPRSNVTPMAGVEYRANEIQTILDGKFLTNQTALSQVITVFLISLALMIAFNYLNILFSTLVSVAAIISYLFLAHFCYRRGLILNMVYPFAAIILSYIASFTYRYFIADKKKREMRSAFGHYVSDKLVEEISKNPDLVKLGGEKRIVTVFFSDIEGSTTYSEKVAIESWVSQMNEYFTAMEKVIKQHDGTLDKYEGDAIMGFFNAPLLQSNHLSLALKAALSMHQTLGHLHQKWQAEGKPLIQFRMGINTGEAIVGNFGSENRFDYTVMGDTVNTASRLESSANKAYKTRMIVAGITPEISQEFLLRELDTVLLPGKNDPVTIYELIDLKASASPETINKMQTYAEGLKAYRDKDFLNAAKWFQSLPQDEPAKIMLERSQILSRGEKAPGVDENLNFRIANK